MQRENRPIGFWQCSSAIVYTCVSVSVLCCPTSAKDNCLIGLVQQCSVCGGQNIANGDKYECFRLSLS